MMNVKPHKKSMINTAAWQVLDGAKLPLQDID